MSPRDALYVAALLQDVGTFIGRASLPEWQRRVAGLREDGVLRAGPDSRGLSAALLHEFAGRKDFLPALSELPPFWDAASAGGSDARGILLHLLRIATGCATSGGADASGATAGGETLLRSPIGRLTLQRSGQTLRLDRPLYLEVAALSERRESLFPVPAGGAAGPDVYLESVRGFLADLDHIHDESGLFALLEKYLVTVAPGPGLDVSLFDVARTTAAVALCLHDEYAAGGWQGLEERIAARDLGALPAPCLLVTGSLSGIQEFIFDVPSKRASKSLKGRSYYVQLAADACVHHLVGSLGLKDASLLYSGGGNFVLLVPAGAEQRLESLHREISDALLPESLSLALGWTRVALADFLEGSRFAERWTEAYARLEARKRRRFQELGARIFTPFRQGPRDEEGTDDVFARLTEQLTRSTGYEFVPAGASGGRVEGRLPERLGLRVEFTGDDRKRTATVFNDTGFAGRFRSFRFAVKDLPRFTPDVMDRLYPGGDVPEEVRRGNVIDFAHLAELAEDRTGTAKLGILKMDVDNLGELFVRGFPPSERSIARVAALSRTLKWFFEGYMNVLLREGGFTWLDAAGAHEAAFAPHLYPVFSGGDDFFLIGAWDAVFEFARTVRREFAEFVGHHPGVTLSAALQVIEPKESVARFAARADERLEEAKLAGPGKDRVSVFDRVLTWAELERAAELKHRLEVLVKQRGEARQIVQRVQQSATGYERMQDAARRGVFRPEKIWRLAYFLSRNARKENQEEVRRIAELHERLVLSALVRPEEAASPALFVVAGRWAELATRRVPAQAGA